VLEEAWPVELALNGFLHHIALTINMVKKTIETSSTGQASSSTQVCWPPQYHK
jgi:hypothetical protein